jgi:hypothetical protein
MSIDVVSPLCQRMIDRRCVPLEGFNIGHCKGAFRADCDLSRNDVTLPHQLRLSAS